MALLRCGVRPGEDAGDHRRRGLAAERGDLRESLTTTGCLDDPVERQEYLEAWRRSGVTCIFQNSGVESQAVRRASGGWRISRGWWTACLNCTGGRWRRTTSRRPRPRAGDACTSVATACRWPGMAIRRGGAGIHRQLLPPGLPDDACHYNRRNMLGDGCAEPGDAGLSDFGRAAIKEMNAWASSSTSPHSGQRTSLEAAKASSVPIVASHSACMALNRTAGARATTSSGPSPMAEATSASVRSAHSSAGRSTSTPPRPH